MITLELVAACIASLLVYATFMGLRRKSRERRQEDFRSRWQDLIYAWMAGDKLTLPRLSPGERGWLLLLLIEMNSIVRGESAQALREIGRECGMPEFVMGLLASHIRWRRGLGIRGAATLQLAEAVPVLERLIQIGRAHV